MKRLVVLRHAKAEKEGRRDGDFARALAPRGAEDAVETGRALARRGLLPDGVVTSPAPRALETARLVARELDFPWARIRTEKSAYLADAETLLAIVRRADERVRTLLLVGHNPGISELAQLLGRGFEASLPTGAAAAFDLYVDVWAAARAGGASLLWYEVPSRHR